MRDLKEEFLVMEQKERYLTNIEIGDKTVPEILDRNNAYEMDGIIGRVYRIREFYDFIKLIQQSEKIEDLEVRTVKDINRTLALWEFWQ